MALFAAKLGGKESLQDVFDDFNAGDSAAQRKHVHVVVLHSLAGAVGIGSDPGAHAVDLVGGDAGTDSASANDYAAVGVSAGYVLGDLEGEVGIVVQGVVFVRAQAHDVVTQSLDFLL